MIQNAWGLDGHIILASGSSFKKRLIENAGFSNIETQEADVDETVLPKEKPTHYVKRVALAKALEVAKNHPKSYVIGADTVIVAKGQIVRKAYSEDEARKKLHLLSGSHHIAMTGYAICSPGHKPINRVIKTRVVLKDMTEDEIEALIQAGEWKNVAAYKIEGMLSALVKRIYGSYPNIVGLPVYHISEDLKKIMKK